MSSKIFKFSVETENKLFNVLIILFYLLSYITSLATIIFLIVLSIIDNHLFLDYFFRNSSTIFLQLIIVMVGSLVIYRKIFPKPKIKTIKEKMDNAFKNSSTTIFTKSLRGKGDGILKVMQTYLVSFAGSEKYPTMKDVMDAFGIKNVETVLRIVAGYYPVSTSDYGNFLSVLHELMSRENRISEDLSEEDRTFLITIKNIVDYEYNEWNKSTN